VIDQEIVNNIDATLAVLGQPERGGATYNSKALELDASVGMKNLMLHHLTRFYS